VDKKGTEEPARKGRAGKGGVEGKARATKAENRFLVIWGGKGRGKIKTLLAAKKGKKK